MGSHGSRGKTKRMLLFTYNFGAYVVAGLRI